MKLLIRQFNRVYPREVIKSGLEHHAAAMVFAHNHPSGDPSPSTQDFAITRDLFLAGKIMSIQVLDHLIIGRNRYYSFADQGHIRKWEKEFGEGPEIILKTLGEDLEVSEQEAVDSPETTLPATPLGTGGTSRQEEGN